MKNFIKTALISGLFGFGGAWVFQSFVHENNIETTIGNQVIPEENNAFKINNSGFAENVGATDFVEASKSSTNSVVYIKNISKASYSVSWMDLFFGGEPNKEVRVSSGSGVIFSTDGYIVSNNHVVAGAEKIEVVVGKRTLEAKLVGVDPSSDLAVLKVDATNLPAVTLGNSKDLSVGEWVIAVGNPFNLNSTVTAGIVSAKGRQINILKEKFPIESFIQTDAAINPGNSGGALIDSEGKLVGINTAILSMTGSYAGYGFAVPVDIVKKVFHDIVKYGEVQKSFFGADVEDFTSSLAERLDIKTDEYSGVLTVYLQKEGAAAKAGIKEGDVIVSIDGVSVDTRAEFEEEISYRSPGEKISVGYKRNGKNYVTETILTNREGTTEVLKRHIVNSDYLGAKFEELSKVERELLGIENGIRIFSIGRGRMSGMENDFVITHINQTQVKTADKLIDILEHIDGVVWIEGVNKNGKKMRYRYYGG